MLQTLEFDQILYRLSRHAATELGKERAHQLRPSTRFPEVLQRLEATDEAVTVQRLKGAVPFGGIRDIRPHIQRAKIGGMLQAQELLDIAQTLYGGRRLKKILLSIDDDHAIDHIRQLCAQWTNHQEVEEAITRCIDEIGEIRDTASPDLQYIRKEIRQGEARIRERLEQLIRTPSVKKKLQDALITIRNDRYVIPVKQEYRADFGGMIHDQSASGATLFIEPEVIVQLNNRLRELKLKEQTEIEKILTQLSSRVADIHESLQTNIEVVAELDFIFAKASLAYEWNATLPQMNDQGRMHIKKGRHPLIAPERVVPIDVELGNSHTIIVITGPNTGGKTVTLKTIGLLHLMAMSGLFIPAQDGSQLCVFDGIYVDIGDEQSIEQNLSTFSGHLTNIIQILRQITPKSLVLLDELGAGTDPAEGSALAIALLHHIQQVGCRLVATTHYNELKTYAYDQQGIINASMEFDVETLSPTYRLLMGIPGRSNAFAIAEKLGLPKSIIEYARTRVNKENLKVDSMLASLEHNRLTAEQERKTAEQLHHEADQLKKKYEGEVKRIEVQKEQMLQQAVKEAQNIVAKARQEADRIIAELRKMALEEQVAIKEHKLTEMKRRLDETEQAFGRKEPTVEYRVDRGPIAVGDEVLVTTFGQKGVVLEEAGSGEFIVQLGMMKMKVSQNQLQRIGQSKKQPEQQTLHVKRSRDERVRLELDLRGYNLDEAMIEVDRFLDEAVMSNLGQVYIIHGKGTGTLRSGIQQYLQNHKLVRSHRIGNYNEGGAGVTVVELK